MLEKFGGWPVILSELCVGTDLSSEKTEAILSEILSGEADPSQIAAFLVAIKVKGETVEEITGLVRAMNKAAETLLLPDETIDIVGTGGSPQRREAALNVSTMSAFVAAASGATVCKHGNRRASSTSGAFDLLDALGIPVEQTPSEVEKQVLQNRLGFAFAKTFHPAMRFAGPVRAEIGVPTVFNILGPLSHPGGVTRHLIGTTSTKIADQMSEVLLANGSKRAWVVTGEDSLDEISITGSTRVKELKNGQISEFIFEPSELGLEVATQEHIRGGTPEENAQIAIDIFSGLDKTPKRTIVALNAAAGLVVGGVLDNIKESFECASASIDDGSVLKLLDSCRKNRNDSK